MGFCPFLKKKKKKKIQYFASFPKLIREMHPIFKFNFLKIEFQFKTQFLDNQVITNWKLKKKKKCMELEFLGLEFHAIFLFFYFLFIYLFFLKFDCPIPITAFRKPYSDVLNGTRALWTQVPCNFFFFFYYYKVWSPHTYSYI